MLEIQKLSKSYGDLAAVKELSLSLKPGEIFGFIGSNGAGKTTTIKMLATLLEPTSGTAKLNGVDVCEDPMQIRRMIGYMPDFFGLYDDVKVVEYLDFFAALYDVPNKQRRLIVNDVLAMTNLESKRDAFVQSLSRGMQQRLCLARCLVHDPALLLLDEPASGLDPRARAELKELLLDLSQSGKIILVSSHILPELADFCSVVGIIEKGELLAFGGVEEIVRRHSRTRRLRIRVIENIAAAAERVSRFPGVCDVSDPKGDSISLEFDGELKCLSELLADLIHAKFEVVGFTEIEDDLQDIFLKLTKGEVN